MNRENQIAERDGMLKDLKLLLGMDPKDDSQDDKLLWILSSARARLKVLLGGVDPPAEMEHIITEAAVIRFNRIGSEGMTINTVEGENLHFNSNDFAGFMDGKGKIFGKVSVAFTYSKCYNVLMENNGVGLPARLE